MPSSINAEHLDTFIAFAEHLNFTKAARARRMSQPALHTHVKKLSEALGVTLYTRRGQRLVLTADGERVLGFGRDAAARSAAFVAELSHREVVGPVVLCSGEGAYLYLLGPALRKLALGEAALRRRSGEKGRLGVENLRLLVRDQEGTVHAVRTGEAHLGVASLDAEPAGLSAEPFASVGQMVLLPKEHPLAEKKVVRCRDLAGQKLVVPPLDRPHRAMIAQALKAASVKWHVAVEASGWELLVRFAELGFGFTIVNAFCRVPPNLVGRPMPELPERTYYLLKRGDSADSGVVSMLANLLRTSAKEWKKSMVRGH